MSLLITKVGENFTTTPLQKRKVGNLQEKHQVIWEKVNICKARQNMLGPIPKCHRVSENLVMYVCFQIIGENSLNASPDPQEDVFDTLDKGTEKSKVKKRFLFESRSDSCFSLNKSIDNENVSSISVLYFYTVGKNLHDLASFQK